MGHRRLSIIDLSPEGRQPMVGAAIVRAAMRDGRHHARQQVALRLGESGDAAHYGNPKRYRQVR
jgi:hypothetical protein